MKKYPRTYHLPFSPCLQNDDRMCDTADLLKLIKAGAEMVIYEKLDGGNTAMKGEGIFARTHATPTSCTTFDYVKSRYFSRLRHIIQKDNLVVFGENLFAIHAVEYTNLQDYFYAFNVQDRVTDFFYSHDQVTEWTEYHGVPMVPVVYEGKIESLKWLEQFLANKIKEGSAFGGPCEGFVVRTRSGFHVDDFGSKVFKWVRENHIQTKLDDRGQHIHWRRNWKQAKLNKQEEGAQAPSLLGCD